MANIEALGRVIAQHTSSTFDRFAVKDFAVVETEAELLVQLGQEESFEDVFNNWHRFSRRGASGLANNSSLPNELEAWRFEPENNQVVCEINSESYVGFISPDRHDFYVFESIVKSPDNDDDHAGLIAAYVTDDNGDTHTLEFMRHGNGLGPASINKNYHMSSHRITIERIQSGLTWTDGAISESRGNGEGAGWRAAPEGVLCKITRAGDILTFETSQFNDVTEYFEPAKRTIDLSSDPSLEVFRGPQRFGYGCHSQRLTSWEVLSRPGARAPILSLMEGLIYEWDGDSWNTTPITSSFEGLRNPGFYLNVLSEKLYYIDLSKSIITKMGQN